MSHTAIPTVTSPSPLSPAGPLKGNRPHSHFTRSLSQNQSRTSLLRADAGAAASPEPVRSQHTNGLRAQLHHLLPRHALFHVRLDIHQISNVPLLYGEFGVRWKFKNVHNVPGSKATLLGIMKGRSKGKGRDTDRKGREEAEEQEDEDADDSPESADGSPPTQSTEDAISIPSVVVSGHTHSNLSPSPSSTSIMAASSSSASVSSSNKTVTGLASPTPYANYLTADWLPSLLPPPIAVEEVPSLSSSTPIEAYASARGMTEFIRLKEHTITWEHTLDIVVKMDVERDTLDLLPNELKLAVMQRVIQGDPDAPHNPRLGALYLNLAEYANAGSVTRRYLLRESKTNATLKLTIQLEHVGGETAYKAPPLLKAEILGRIAGLLDKDVYRTRPKMLDLHSLYQDHKDRGPKSANVGIGVRSSGVNGAYEDILMDGLPFDANRLPLAYGPKTTETLIETIFNPVPTSSTLVSPFTYYAPSESFEKPGVGANDVDLASVYSSSEETTHTVKSSSTSTSGQRSVSGSSRQISEEGHGEGQKPKPWWKKIGSRPGTPAGI